MVYIVFTLDIWKSCFILQSEWGISSHVLLRFAHLEAELDLTHSDQRRVLHILWCIAEKERIENLQDVVSWSKSVCLRCFWARCRMLCRSCLNRAVR